MRRASFVPLVALVLAFGAGRAAAQESRCTLVDDPDRDVNITNQGTEFETWFVTDAVFECEGGRRLVADQATYSAAAGQITLNGNVHVEDAERTLTSGFAQYFVESRQMHARQNVVLTQKETGSRIMAELLDAYEESPQRPQGLVIATGGLPRAVLFQQRDSAAVADSTTLDAREIRIEGESFRGTGSAVLRRDSLTARGDVISWLQDVGMLDVMVAAHVEMPQQNLRGDSITATINDQDEIEAVIARRGAQLETEDLDVTAPAIRLLFEEGEVVRMVAMYWAGDSAAQPRIDSEEFRMVADSIDVLAPGQQLTEAVAIGNAHGERVLPDSLRSLLPDSTPDILALLGSDWMSGDTVRARFAPNPAAETDTTAAETIMERLTAFGDQAQSMYSVRNEDDPDAGLAFNYLRSDWIDVVFEDGVASVVSAAGNARGVYLQPREAAAAAERVGVADGRGR